MSDSITELVFVVDCSGSMCGLEADTIGGFNSMLEKQKQGEGTAYISTVFFNHQRHVIHDRLAVAEVPLLSRNDYRAAGSTALLDAVGNAIKHIKMVHKYQRSEDVPQKTLFVIITDGEENSSREYTFQKVKRMIQAQQKLGWEFIFLGANIDTIEAASKIGIRESRAGSYCCSPAGVSKNYSVLSDVCESIRTSGDLGDNWEKFNNGERK